jgi:hypothetical protein
LVPAIDVLHEDRDLLIRAEVLDIKREGHLRLNRQQSETVSVA